MLLVFVNTCIIIVRIDTNIYLLHSFSWYINCSPSIEQNLYALVKFTILKILKINSPREHLISI